MAFEEIGPPKHANGTEWDFRTASGFQIGGLRVIRQSEVPERERSTYSQTSGYGPARI
jgi:hypothetical protein